MKSILKEILKTLNKSNEEVEIVSTTFFHGLDKLQDDLKKDLQAIYHGDPAAESFKEIILTYPGFLAISFYRIANRLVNLDVELIPRIITEYAHSVTGIDIHPKAKIGNSFCIDHGTGVVIGETTIIGNRVKIYQGVTIGALSVPKRNVSGKRHPTIEDDVVVYAQATILGGNTTIGKGAIIGGNTWITSSVIPETKVTYESQVFKVLKNHILKVE